jgi:hypothetical protein
MEHFVIPRLVQLIWFILSSAAVWGPLYYLGYALVIFLEIAGGCDGQSCISLAVTFLTYTNYISCPAFVLGTVIRPWRHPSISWLFNWTAFYGLSWNALVACLVQPTETGTGGPFDIWRIEFLGILCCLVLVAVDYCKMSPMDSAPAAYTTIVEDVEKGKKPNAI